MPNGFISFDLWSGRVNKINIYHKYCKTPSLNQLLRMVLMDNVWSTHLFSLWHCWNSRGWLHKGLVMSQFLVNRFMEHGLRVERRMMNDQHRLPRGCLNIKIWGNYYKHWKLLKAVYNKKMFRRHRKTHLKANEGNQSDKIVSKLAKLKT